MDDKFRERKPEALLVIYRIWSLRQTLKVIPTSFTKKESMNTTCS